MVKGDLGVTFIVVRVVPWGSRYLDLLWETFWTWGGRHRCLYLPGQSWPGGVVVIPLLWRIYLSHERRLNDI